ncbi:cytochrome c biogenesis protein CcsA [Planctomycetota bacterium]
MAVKYSTQGLLIYTAMFFYLGAFVVSLARYRKLGSWLYFVGFCFAATTFLWRWIMVGYIPLQNLFEIFLLMGILVWPLTLFCSCFLKIDAGRFDMLIGFVVLLPAGFVFTAESKALPPALQSWLFGPHVAVYMLAYIVMAKAAIEAARHLYRRSSSLEMSTYKMVRLGFGLLTAGLVLGSYWAKQAWGDWWGWDPKEMWSLAVWLIFAGYLHFRAVFAQKYAKVNSFWVIAGFSCIIICLMWVNLSKIFAGLHSYAY